MSRNVVAAMTAYTLELRQAEVKLNQNESPFDFPRELKEAVLARMLERPWNLYPDFESQALRNALARAHGFGPENTLVGNGSNELLAATVSTFVGPGNAYVTAAKARLVGEVGIDMTAGPTELVVICDESANEAFVQADLDAQAEHGADSAVICICVGRPRNVRATLVLAADSVEEAIAIANRIAPEHLSIQTRNAAHYADAAVNCGAIFCGPASPVAAGDYIAGPNHILPTGGSARFFSPLGVYDFVKRSNIIALDAADLAEVGPLAERIALFEGLPNHAKSIEERNAACPATS